ncbi:hypothetical protein J2T19_001036 [Paenibacillus tundrae]|uniref:Uncharacterized protein n=1 Tax=Paenibacillus tundrae TaxID=528187 RepID=A0ABT9W8L6_9BACL|nr:hypothetical protein [Paenibacillus tundrae]
MIATISLIAKSHRNNMLFSQKQASTSFMQSTVSNKRKRATSLRWYDPDQVQRVRNRILPSQPHRAAPLVFI